MSFEAAPLHEDVARAPAGGEAVWLTARDGVKIRVALWGHRKATKATILLFPGRTEYIEKYGVTAAGFVDRGYAVAVVDWRGQGIAERLLNDRMLGHVGAFKDYQHDVAAMLGLVQEKSLPEPLFLVAHSMGGCIGLRALIEGLPVNASVFTGPMWDISLTPGKRNLGWVASTIAHQFGFGGILSPGTISETYVLANPFEDNMLTRDIEMWELMQEQVRTYPDLSLGGPSLTWLNEALRECRALKAHPTPNVPCLCYLGTNERIVDTATIHDRMSRWPNGALELVDGGEHEILMEGPALRERIFNEIDGFFAANAIEAKAG
ncbi:MAG: alpha/beta hydrolase [Pseudomonadota bacterium]